MRVAAALRTLRQHKARMLASRAESCQACQQRGKTNGLGGTPVRLLECMSRVNKFLSANHEGGSGPAHP